MATRILEYGGNGGLGAGYPVIPADQFVAAQSAMTASSSSAQSAAFNVATSLVIIDSDEAIKVSFGSSPTATDDNIIVYAGTDRAFSVKPGWKVAIKT